MTFLLLNGFCQSHRKFYRETLDREKFFYLVLKIIQDSFGLALPRLWFVQEGRAIISITHIQNLTQFEFQRLGLFA